MLVSKKERKVRDNKCSKRRLTRPPTRVEKQEAVAYQSRFQKIRILLLSITNLGATAVFGLTVSSAAAGMYNLGATE